LMRLIEFRFEDRAPENVESLQLLKTLPGDVCNDIFEQAGLSLVHFHAEHALRTYNIGEKQAAFDHAVTPKVFVFSPICRATVTTG
jgi:hypothetical protein